MKTKYKVVKGENGKYKIVKHGSEKKPEAKEDSVNDMLKKKIEDTKKGC